MAMEGEGEGMVAVVQGLRDAGLAVTLMGGRRQRKRHVATDEMIGRLSHAKSSMETNTNVLATFPTVNAAAQICDDRYTSSYQLAHCWAMPTSPPVESTEFPPQRAEPCRTQGNFEIRALGSMEAPLPSKRSRGPYPVRDSFTSVDRGVLSHPASSKCAESFAHSLRRYPSLSPTSGMPTDLVQRLLAYTQAKNFSKSSYHTNSARLRNKNIEPTRDTPKTKLSKSVQTYTRGKKERENVAADGGRKETDGGQKKGDLKKGPKKCRSPSPSGSLDIRFTDDDLLATFDYLKSRSRFGQTADVRYLSDVARSLRNTLRNMCDDSSGTCPNMQYRYSQHRREHHRNSDGQEPTSSSNNIQTQGSSPMVSKGVAAMSSCEAIPGTYQQTCPNRPKLCCYCRKPLPCSCGKTHSPVQIQKFRSSSTGSCLNLNRGKNGRSSISFNLPDDIEGKIEDEVMDWLRHIPVYVNDNCRDKCIRREMARGLISKLKGIKDDKDFLEKARAEITECVKNMPMWCPGNSNDQKLFKEQIVDYLVDKLSDITKTKTDKFYNIISQWVESLGFEQDVNKRDVVNNLVSKLRPIALNPPSDKEDLKTSLKYEIIGILKELPIAVEGDETKFINKLADDVASKLVNVPASEVLHASVSSQQGSVDLEDAYLKLIWDWTENIPDFPQGKENSQYKKPVESLAKKLKDLQSHDIDNDETQEEMAHEIDEWLTNNAPNKELLDSSTKEELEKSLMERLVNATKEVERNKSELSDQQDNVDQERKDNDGFVRDIMSCLGDIPDFDVNSSENANMIKEFTNKINKLRADKASKDELNDELVNWLNVVIENSNAKLSTTEKNRLIQKLMNVITALPKQKERKRWTKQSPKKVMESIREEIGNILDDTHIDSDNRDEIESALADILADQVLRGENNEQTKKRIIDALEGFNISHEQAEEIANSLLDVGNEMSLMNKTQDSFIINEKKKFNLSPMQREMFQETAEREILDFAEEVTGDDSTISRNKRKVAAQKLAKRVGDILTNKGSTDEDKRELIQSEIPKHFDGLSIKKGGAGQDQVSQLADRLQNVAFKTSTPKRSSFSKDTSFKPRRGSRDSTISAIEDVSTTIPTQQPTKEEQKYLNQVTKQLDDWINSLHLDLFSGEGKKVKDMMIKDIAADIIDRKKYLQLNPGTKPTDKEELEHLKYQVFRWLNKMTDDPNVLASISKTKELMDRIKGVPVPQLINSSKPERRPSKTKITRESSVQHLSNGLASLQSEITKWYNAIPAKYKPAKNKKQIEESVKDLAEQIGQLQKEDALTEEVFDDVVTGWLQKTLKNASENYVNSVKEGLKGVVFNKETAKPDNKSLGRKTSISTSSAKSVQKSKVKGSKVKDSLIKELSDSSNDLVNEETEARSRSSSVDTESETAKPSTKTADLLYNSIEDWCDSLPIEEGDTPEERERVKNLKQSIAGKLINVIGDLNMKPEILNDDLLYEDLLNDEIDEILSSLPPSPELENNLPVLKQNLIEKVKEAKAKMQEEHAEFAHKQQIRDTISKTLPNIDNLTVEEQAPFEILKDNLADAYIEFNYAAGSEEDKNKLKRKISTEINQFCNDYLSRYPASPIDPKQLNNDLLKMLQNVSDPKDETIKSEVEQVRIKSNINDWLNELPLRDDETPTEKLQRNKIVNLLAKGLHDIEKEKERNPDIDVEERMRNEVKKWIKKLPIKPDEEDKIDEQVDNLISKLKESEESRRFSVSDIKHSTDLAGDEDICDICESFGPCDPDICKPSKPQIPSMIRLSEYVPCIPPSTLSTEDKAHLQRIRERNGLTEPSSTPCYCKDAAVNPIPSDVGNQTEQWQNGSTQSMQPCGQMPMQPCSWPQEYAPNQAPNPLSPQVLVKEYYWNTPQGESSNFPCSDQNLDLGQSVQYQNSWPGSPEHSARFATPQQSQGPNFTPDPSQYMDEVPQQTSGMTSTRQLPCDPPPCMPSKPPCAPPPCVPPPCAPPPCERPPCVRPPCVRPPCVKPPCVKPPCVKPPYVPPPCVPSTSRPPPCRPPLCRPQPCIPPSCLRKSTSPEHAQPSNSSNMQEQSTPRMSMRQSPQQSSQNLSYPMPSQLGRKSQEVGPSMDSCEVPPCMSSFEKPPCSPRPRPCSPKPSPSGPPPCMPRPCRPSRRTSRSPEMSSSSPFDSEYPDFNFGPKVTKLGSFDEVPSKACGSQSPRAKRSRGTPDEDTEWTIRFPEDAQFWGTPCPRRRVRSPQREEGFVKEKERKEEKMRCRCSERVVTRCTGRPPPCPAQPPCPRQGPPCPRQGPPCPRQGPPCRDTLEHCPKCCGAHCPHPSYLFFR